MHLQQLIPLWLLPSTVVAIRAVLSFQGAATIRSILFSCVVFVPLISFSTPHFFIKLRGLVECDEGHCKCLSEIFVGCLPSPLTRQTFYSIYFDVLFRLKVCPACLPSCNKSAPFALGYHSAPFTTSPPPAWFPLNAYGQTSFYLSPLLNFAVANRELFRMCKQSNF